MTDDNVKKRVDQAMAGGTPKVNPDEQRKFLGTFQERVAIAIKVSQDTNPQAVAKVKSIIQDHHGYLVIINGNIPSEQQSPYIRLATANNAKFTLKNDKSYGTKPNDYAIVVAANEAINVGQVEFQPTNIPHEIKPKAAPKKKSFWKRLFH